VVSNGTGGAINPYRKLELYLNAVNFNFCVNVSYISWMLLSVPFIIITFRTCNFPLLCNELALNASNALSTTSFEHLMICSAKLNCHLITSFNKTNNNSTSTEGASHCTCTCWMQLQAKHLDANNYWIFICSQEPPTSLPDAKSPSRVEGSLSVEGDTPAHCIDIELHLLESLTVKCHQTLGWDCLPISAPPFVPHPPVRSSIVIRTYIYGLSCFCSWLLALTLLNDNLSDNDVNDAYGAATQWKFDLVLKWVMGI